MKYWLNSFQHLLSWTIFDLHMNYFQSFGAHTYFIIAHGLHGAWTSELGIIGLCLLKCIQIKMLNGNQNWSEIFKNKWICWLTARLTFSINFQPFEWPKLNRKRFSMWFVLLCLFLSSKWMVCFTFRSENLIGPIFIKSRFIADLWVYAKLYISSTALLL